MFKDETEHVTLGWMMWRFEKKLYSDLSTNHQPLPVLAGLALTKMMNFNTLYQLIERMRLAMFLFYCLAMWGLIIRFRWQGFWVSLLTFSASYYFFGWHVLAESLVWPFVAYVVLAGLNWAEGELSGLNLDWREDLRGRRWVGISGEKLLCWMQ